MGNTIHSRCSAQLCVLTVLAALLAACGGPPTEAMDAAERSLLDAAWAEECAEETYRSARKMLDEAKAASAEGNYDEAKRKADAAARLAEQARLDAEAGRDDCERRKQARNAIENKLDPNPQVVVNQGDQLTLETVFFEFDQSVLSDDARGNLDANAQYLLKNEDVRVRIEGHTDSRGSTEYNLALSQRRAAVTKRYLQALGIDPSRMNVVPYGEERPATYGEGDNDHARNRRAEFVPF